MFPLSALEFYLNMPTILSGHVGFLSVLSGHVGFLGQWVCDNNDKMRRKRKTSF